MIWQLFSGHRNVKAFHHKSSKNQSINAMFDWCGKSIKFLTCALANGELLRFIGKIQKAWCFPFSFAMNCFEEKELDISFNIKTIFLFFFSIKFQLFWVIFMCSLYNWTCTQMNIMSARDRRLLLLIGQLNAINWIFLTRIIVANKTVKDKQKWANWKQGNIFSLSNDQDNCRKLKTVWF